MNGSLLSVSMRGFKWLWEMENLGVTAASRLLITTFKSHQPTGPRLSFRGSLCIEWRGKKYWVKERIEKKRESWVFTQRRGWWTWMSLIEPRHMVFLIPRWEHCWCIWSLQLPQWSPFPSPTSNASVGSSSSRRQSPVSFFRNKPALCLYRTLIIPIWWTIIEIYLVTNSKGLFTTWTSLVPVVLSSKSHCLKGIITTGAINITVLQLLLLLLKMEIDEKFRNKKMRIWVWVNNIVLKTQNLWSRKFVRDGLLKGKVIDVSNLVILVSERLLFNAQLILVVHPDSDSTCRTDWPGPSG